MIFTEKDLKYADLVVPFTKCPLGDPIKDCPFTEYWKIEDPGERIKIIDELSDVKLDELRAFHHQCLAIKIEKAKERTVQLYKHQNV